MSFWTPHFKIMAKTLPLFNVYMFTPPPISWKCTFITPPPHSPPKIKDWYVFITTATHSQAIWQHQISTNSKLIFGLPDIKYHDLPFHKTFHK